MKSKYSKPHISVEELLNDDVILSSVEVDPNRYDNANLSGKDDAQNSIFTMENIL